MHRKAMRESAYPKCFRWKMAAWKLIGPGLDLGWLGVGGARVAAAHSGSI